jgi:hypothetical protein
MSPMICRTSGNVAFASRTVKYFFPGVRCLPVISQAPLLAVGYASFETQATIPST